MTRPARRQALVLYGGWEGHDPAGVAHYAAQAILDEFDVALSDDLGELNAARLAAVDLLVPVWTYGELTDQQEGDWLEAVARGMGVLAWHGIASAFLASRMHKFLIGGQFVAHPGDMETTYRVRFDKHDPLVAGLDDFELTTEQYYMLIDPAVHVLAMTTVCGGGMDWVAGVEMPVAWTRRWGRGRVFYCSLGHSVQELGHPTVLELLKRGARWATAA